MLKQQWDYQEQLRQEKQTHLNIEYQGVKRDIEKLLDKIVETSNTTVATRLEDRLEDLEKQKLVLEEKMLKTDRPNKSFEEVYRTSVEFLLNPYKHWASGHCCPIVSGSYNEPHLRLVFFGIRW